MVSQMPTLDPATISDIIEMALSDHITFAMIKDQHGLSSDQVKALMRAELKPGSYRHGENGCARLGIGAKPTSEYCVRSACGPQPKPSCVSGAFLARAD